MKMPIALLIITLLYIAPCLATAISLETQYPNAAAFIRHEFMIMGIDSTSITIALNEIWESDEHHIYVPQHVLDTLENNSFSDAQKNEYRWLIQHEANHIRYNHETKTKFAFLLASALSIGSPIAAAALTYSAQVVNGKYAGTATALSFLTAPLAFYHYRRSLEYEADDAIANEVPLLKGGIEFLKKCKEQEDHTLPEKCITQAKNLISHHPTPSSRIARLEKRIENIEKRA